MFRYSSALVVPTILLACATAFGSTGVYTKLQAAAGSSAYATNCAVCHGNTLDGGAGPALRGTQFHQMAAAQALTADSLLAVITKLMPQTAPGSLTPAQYSDITAYILQQNDYSAGSAPLAADSAPAKALKLGP